mgnify:CR=1 FL=1
MSRATKLIAAIAALLTAVGGVIAGVKTLTSDDAPIPVTTIIIQEPGDYANYLAENPDHWRG